MERLSVIRTTAEIIVQDSVEERADRSPGNTSIPMSMEMAYHNDN
jgi:hypothetical protein